ncbi:two-component sensor histidine kinase [Sphingomonas lenta]|uniref:histidine kinase n=1 Tax=Sphingomonas lenta TaxID=1141887 RepID=A0A2A2SC61_9SPHN|nr:two-component sensor histidine kinase [Sphingomonas lenta]
MIRAAKDWLKRRWPRLRLRTILFAVLFFVAALPGVGAVGLRVYENTLVRQTESELIAQSAALAAAAAALWPGAPPLATPPAEFRPEPPSIDLSTSPILPERPPPRAIAGAPDPVARRAAQRIAPVLRRTRRTTLASIALLDGRGRLIGTAAGYAHLPEVARALRGRPATVLRRHSGYRAVYRFEWLSRAAAIRVHHARPIVVEGRVVGVLLLSRSARALFRGLYEDRGKIALGVLSIFLLLVILSGVLSRGIAKPIEGLGSVTRQVAGGRGGVRVPDPPTTAAVEIQGLYADFATMADRVERRSRYLRDFAHAVSHEFKTPLAGIRGALELLADHGAEMSAAERARFIANADADAGRLTALVTRLLELARADMTPGAGGETIDPVPVLARVADAFRTPDFAVALPADLPRLAMSASALEAALTTLFENSRQAGATRIAVAAERRDATLVLRVADDGPGIAPTDRARVFEPFFTTKRAGGGTGLGLPILRSLLESDGATIALTDSVEGAAFELELPIA